MRLPLALPLALLLAGGCVSSPPMRFYTLSVVGTDSSASGARETARAPLIGVGRVKLPGEIDRSELVQRIDANRVRLAEQDRWAAPLEDMIRRTLSADLQLRQPGAADTQSGMRRDLSVDIQEFIGDAQCAVSLRASWELKASGMAADAPTTRGYESIHIPAPASCDVSALPAAMSQALAELSERILDRHR